jgi:hypothetical protein
MVHLHRIKGGAKNITHKATRRKVGGRKKVGEHGRRPV